jgi:hypothetical protein
MPAELAAIVTPTEYRVSCLPEDLLDMDVWEITVAYRGRGLWAVTRHSRCSLGADGTWSWGPGEADEDEWRATHRFDLDTALRLAREHAPHVTVNGMTPADFLAHHATRAATAAPEETP